MQFLANENFPLPSVHRLRQAGHDVVAVIETMPGATDEEVLELAAAEQRLLLTFDRDYGELIYRLNMPSPLGVLYFRLIPANPEEPAEMLLLSLLIGPMAYESQFTVIERGQVRQRPLPS